MAKDSIPGPVQGGDCFAVKSFDDQHVSRTSFPKIRAIIGIALFILIAGTSSIWLYTSTHIKQPPKVQLRPYSVHRSEEIPASPHRTQSMVPTEQPTTLTPWGIALDNVRGFVWIAEPGCQAVPKCPLTIPGIIGQYALSDGNFIQDFREPRGYSSPLFLIVDSDSHIWFTQLNANKIGFFNTHTHSLVENPIPTANSEPYGITVDPQGKIWFAENRLGLGQIGSFTPTPSGTIKITEYSVGTLRPHLITADRAGNIWYSEGFSGDIGEFSPTTGNVNTFFVSPSTCPVPCTKTHISGIQVDSKGNVWFTDAISQRVGYLVPSTGQVMVRSLDPAENPHPNDGLIIDSSDRVWFTEQFGLGVSMWLASTANQKD